MADANTLTPTDAELMQVIKDVAKNSAINRDGSTSLRIARAVLAKWGTPAPASQPVAAPVGMEPVAWVEVRPGLDGWFLAYNFNPDAQTEPLYSGFQVQAMLTAARKPIADEVLHALYTVVMSGHYVDALHYWRGTSAHQYARAIENAHGIKATNQENIK